MQESNKILSRVHLRPAHTDKSARNEKFEPAVNLLITIFELSRNDKKCCYASRKYLAEMIGVHENSVYNYISLLRKKGHIRKDDGTRSLSLTNEGSVWLVNFLNGKTGEESESIAKASNLINLPLLKDDQISAMVSCLDNFGKNNKETIDKINGYFKFIYSHQIKLSTVKNQSLYQAQYAEWITQRLCGVDYAGIYSGKFKFDFLCNKSTEWNNLDEIATMLHFFSKEEIDNFKMFFSEYKQEFVRMAKLVRQPLSAVRHKHFFIRCFCQAYMKANFNANFDLVKNYEVSIIQKNLPKVYVEAIDTVVRDTLIRKAGRIGESKDLTFRQRLMLVCQPS